MKKTLLSMALVTLSLYAQGDKFTYDNIIGQWEISPIRGTTVAFGADYTNDMHYTIDFDRRGEATVLQTRTTYYFLIENSKLLVSEYPPNRRGKFNRPTDVLEVVGTFQGCKKFKYTKKGIAGVSSRYPFKACKIKREPVYTRPYDY